MIVGQKKHVGWYITYKKNQMWTKLTDGYLPMPFFLLLKMSWKIWIGNKQVIICQRQLHVRGNKIVLQLLLEKFI